MRATTLGVIFILVGFLIMLYGFSRPFDFFTPLVGIFILVVGLMDTSNEI